MRKRFFEMNYRAPSRVSGDRPASQAFLALSLLATHPPPRRRPHRPLDADRSLPLRGAAPAAPPPGAAPTLRPTPPLPLRPPDAAPVAPSPQRRPGCSLPSAPPLLLPLRRRPFRSLRPTLPRPLPPSAPPTLLPPPDAGRRSLAARACRCSRAASLVTSIFEPFQTGPMSAAYRRLLLVRCIPHPHLQLAAATHCLSPTAAAAAALVTPTCPSVETPLSSFQPGFTSDGNFKHSWHRKLGLSAGAVLIGQAAFLLGLSNGYAFAHEDSVIPAATSEKAEVNATGLQRIEDGSVVSNEHTVKWRIFTDNARELFQKRQFDEAEKLFQAALLEAKEGFGLRDPHVASALNNLAEFYRLKKEYEKAEQLYLEAIVILEESFGSDDIRVGTALHSLGMCYHLQNKFAHAQTCYERALKIEGRVMGVGHPEYASTMYLLAKVLSLQGKRRAAESLTEESIRILEEVGLGQSPTCIQRMTYLSTELTKSKRFAEAEIWQRKILHALELSKGWDSLHTTTAAELLSLNLQALGKLKESEELLERSLAAKKKILPEGHLQVAVTLVQLARLTLHKFASDLKNVNRDVATYYLARAQQLSNDSIRIAEGILNFSSKHQNKPNSTSATDRDKIAATVTLLQALDVVGLIDIAAKRVLAPGEQDYISIEDALHKCISLYREPDTRRLVRKVVKHEYMMCLKLLMEYHLVVQQPTELLSESLQIIEELGEESNRK